MPWKPSEPGERPSLGWEVLDWITENLIVPDGPSAGDPLVFTGEQAQFVLNLYELDPKFKGPAIIGRAMNNGRLVRRAILSRPKGWGKSPLVGALCLVEALADVVLDGWDAKGQPVGRAWTSLGFKAKVQIVAVSEDQTTNTWEPTLDMARKGPVYDNYNIDPMETFIALPRGRIEAVTASGLSREGFRPVFVAMDQTESWTSTNGGVKLAAAIRRNLAKVNGCSVETPNAPRPGEGSVAEKSFVAATQQADGRTRIKSGVLLDHREARPETDPANEVSLRAGLSDAYGESLDVNGGWINSDRLVADYWDPDTEPQAAREFYLNQITHASDAWLSQPEWAGCFDGEKIVADRDVITLGFDGSRSRAQGVTDATALIACRVSDGHLFEPLSYSVWEQPQGVTDWQVPVVEVESAIRAVFDRYTVVGFFADPAKWESYIAQWEATYGSRLKVKATRDHPIEWWMTGGRATQTVRALEQFHSAVLDGELSHDGSFALTRHVLNARRRMSRSGLQIGKAYPDSPLKIDAAIAAVLAYQARLAAIASGVLATPESTVVRRLR